MRNKLRIRDRWIGDEHPVFIIAEVGVTCNYDIELSKELIRVVRESGADAVKFIFWFPDSIMSDRTITYSYDTLQGHKTENMYEMLNELRFSFDEWRELKTFADEQGVLLFATVNSPEGIEYAEGLGLEAYKLSSWDYNYLPLWKRIAALGKPMLIDTGPVCTDEVAGVMELMNQHGNDQSLLLHCYHTDKPSEINMRAIPYLRKKFDTLVGFSAKDAHDDMDLLAVALGAVVLEKRLTMDRSLPGHHHILSKEPNEFSTYVKRMRQAQQALGVEDLIPSKADLQERKRWFRHLVANQEIPAGTVLTPELLEGKRPESGISPECIDQFIGKKTKRSLAYNEALSWDDV